VEVEKDDLGFVVVRPVGMLFVLLLGYSWLGKIFGKLHRISVCGFDPLIGPILVKLLVGPLIRLSIKGLCLHLPLSPIVKEQAISTRTYQPQSSTALSSLQKIKSIYCL
jgi:hypothetical protein